MAIPDYRTEKYLYRVQEGKTNPNPMKPRNSLSELKSTLATGTSDVTHKLGKSLL